MIIMIIIIIKSFISLRKGETQGPNWTQICSPQWIFDKSQNL